MNLPLAPLHYLVFDHGDDGLVDDIESLDALADVEPRHLSGLWAEVCALLDALREKLGEPEPLDDGGTWDCDLEGGWDGPGGDPGAEWLDLLPLWRTGQALPMAPASAGTTPRFRLELSIGAHAAVLHAVVDALGLEAP